MMGTAYIFAVIQAMVLNVSKPCNFLNENVRTKGIYSLHLVMTRFYYLYIVS